MKYHSRRLTVFSEVIERVAESIGAEVYLSQNGAVQGISPFLKESERILDTIRLISIRWVLQKWRRIRITQVLYGEVWILCGARE
jgi:hypothetical protein